MRQDLKLGSEIAISQSTPFIGGDADIDSLDILMLLTSIEREFGVKIKAEEAGKHIFENLGTLTDYLTARLAGTDSAAGASSVPTSSQSALDRLPHRDPFRFVSAITNLDPGKSASGIWTITGQEAFFQGHFPQNPIVPGVLVSEAMAQLSGIVYASGNSRASQGRLAQVDVRFEGAATPPGDILLQSKLTQAAGALTQFDVSAAFKGQAIARGSITLFWPDTAEGKAT